LSIQALDWARRCHVGNSTRKFVLMALADRWNSDTGVCWPSVGWICEFTELSERTVRRALRELEEQGLIVHDGWFGWRADRQTRRYRLAVDNSSTTGGHSDRSCANGGSLTTARGVTQSVTGGHSDPLTIREPLVNRAARTRRSRRPVENLTAPPILSPEETLRMLEQERTR